jgi:hypothetical protein
VGVEALDVDAGDGLAGERREGCAAVVAELELRSQGRIDADDELVVVRRADDRHQAGGVDGDGWQGPVFEPFHGRPDRPLVFRPLSLRRESEMRPL